MFLPHRSGPVSSTSLKRSASSNGSLRSPPTAALATLIAAVTPPGTNGIAAAAASKSAPPVSIRPAPPVPGEAMGALIVWVGVDLLAEGVVARPGAVGGKVVVPLDGQERRTEVPRGHGSGTSFRLHRRRPPSIRYVAGAQLKAYRAALRKQGIGRLLVWGITEEPGKSSGFDPARDSPADAALDADDVWVFSSAAEISKVLHGLGLAGSPSD